MSEICEEINRFKISVNNNFDTLSQVIDINEVISELRSKPTFLKYSSILDAIETPESKINYFLKNALNDVYEIRLFIHTLLHTGQDAAALILDPEKIDLIDISRFGTFNQNDTYNRDPSKRADSKSNAYGMSRPRGFCFLLNNYFTTGTYKEMQRFRYIFQQLNFQVIMKKNLDAKEIYKEILLLSKSDELEKHTAFMFMSISHGSENAEIYGFDGKPLRIQKLLELFDNQKCPLMQRKPRMFFFNCCRGYDSDSGTTVTLSQPSPGSNRPKIPTITDFTICYSTLDGYLAQVDWDEGTKFGKALADSFIERGLYKDLNALLILANQKVVDNCPQTIQPFEWTQNATRQVFFS